MIRASEQCRLLLIAEKVLYRCFSLLSNLPARFRQEKYNFTSIGRCEVEALFGIFEYNDFIRAMSI